MSSKCAWVLVPALSEKSTNRTRARRVPVTGAGSARALMNVSGRVWRRPAQDERQRPLIELVAPGLRGELLAGLQQCLGPQDLLLELGRRRHDAVDLAYAIPLHGTPPSRRLPKRMRRWQASVPPMVERGVTSTSPARHGLSRDVGDRQKWGGADDGRGFIGTESSQDLRVVSNASSLPRARSGSGTSRSRSRPRAPSRAACSPASARRPESSRSVTTHPSRPARRSAPRSSTWVVRPEASSGWSDCSPARRHPSSTPRPVTCRSRPTRAEGPPPDTDTALQTAGASLA